MGAESITVEANAKLNLFLRVLGAREDGYHDIDSVIVPLSLADPLTLRRADSLRLRMVGNDVEFLRVGGGPDNLAVVAALALAEECGPEGGAEIELEKRIPVAAGLGGGSADAAAVLRGLNELWGCGLDARSLEGIAARVGSDVPALLGGSPVRVGGRGEITEPVAIPPIWWTLVPAGFRIRTPQAYRWWDEDGEKSGPDPEPVLAAAAAGDLESLGEALFNDLEDPLVRRHPEIGDTKRRLLDAGALGAVLCGSGPTVAALARDEAHATGLASGFRPAIVCSNRR